MSAPLSLDGLFRRAGVRNADALALADPPNRARFTDGAPRALTYAQADRAISAFAATLRGLGLSTGTVIGLHLPNTVESVVALLGTIRAGMVAAPLPLLWRRQEMTEALGRAGAKAVVTAARIGGCAHAELAMEVAAGLFPVRQIAAFGDTLPDGVVPLDRVLTTASGEPPPAARVGDAPVALTFANGGEGIVVVPHGQAQLHGAGVALCEASRLAPDAPILSTIPLSSFGGLSVTLMPWLITGGALNLHHGFDAHAFAAQSAAMTNGTVVLPGPALFALGTMVEPPNRMVALWRGPLGAGTQAPSPNLIDCLVVDETAIAAARRGEDGLPDPALVEAAGRTAAAGMVAVGAYQFRQATLDALVTAADPGAMIAALPDALLGNRLAGHAGDMARVATALAARGASPLVAGAFRGRQPVPSR